MLVSLSVSGALLDIDMTMRYDDAVCDINSSKDLTHAAPLPVLEQGQVTAAEGLVFATHQQRGLELESDMLEAKASFMTAQASVHSRPVLERSESYA